MERRFFSSDQSQSINFLKKWHASAVTRITPRDPDWVLLEVMVLLHIPPRAVHYKMEDWLQCLWHLHVRKWFHVSSCVVCFLVDDPPEDATHSIKYFETTKEEKVPICLHCRVSESIKLSLPVTERLGTGIVKQKESKR